VKITIPEDLKKDVPNSKWGKLLMATPVVMTVIATLLAGLASSEMTRAQYSRALGAQLQSKAGDQWGYFQAKKLRSAMQRSSIDLLHATVDIQPLEASMVPSSLGPSVSATLLRNELPVVKSATALDPQVKAAMEAIETQRAEDEIMNLVIQIPDTVLAESLRLARKQAMEFDEATKPSTEAIDQWEASVARADKGRRRDVAYARMRYNAVRYDAEARLNQAIANLLELQVRRANLTAERHHRRSGKFFFGMLGAQAAVIMATFAVAAQKRNFLWSLAAVAGLAAIGFAIYVYLRV